MRIRVYSQGNSFVCLLLGIFPFLCSCGKNYTERLAEQPEVASVTSASGTSVTQNEAHNALQAALQALQKNPASINTLRVAVNGQQVSLLTAAVMLGEDSAMIESLLTQGADIKAADQEGTGILHALVGNRHLSDQQKATLVEHCFDRVCADEIRTNETCFYFSRDLRRGLGPSLATPWLEALAQDQTQTALSIVTHMSPKEAGRNGLYHAIISANADRWRYKYLFRQYRAFGIGDENIIQILLDKKIDLLQYETAKPYLMSNWGIPEGVIDHIRAYTVEDVNRNHVLNSPDLWERAWLDNEDAELAIRIIQKMSLVRRQSIPPEELAQSANRALALGRERNRRHQASLETINSEWIRIKEAFVLAGVPANVLDD